MKEFHHGDTHLPMARKRRGEFEFSLGFLRALRASVVQMNVILP